MEAQLETKAAVQKPMPKNVSHCEVKKNFV
jgi:hypothetical protein